MPDLRPMEDWEYTQEMREHLGELQSMYSTEELLKRLYAHIWWDDCTPNGDDDTKAYIGDIFEEGPGSGEGGPPYDAATATGMYDRDDG